ncbi:MAG: hypothetical protein Kow0075_00560 [Salibacteraceae bacterium]
MFVKLSGQKLIGVYSFLFVFERFWICINHKNQIYMKRIFISLFAVLNGLVSFAQTETFESVGLPVDTFDNGSDLNGAFEFDLFTLPNQYDTTFDFWSGFAMSTMRNDSTGGLSNQYSAITGEAESGITYAVGFPPYDKPLRLYYKPLPDVGFRWDRLYVTNTSYAYYSMLNGDMFAKKFGDSSGSDPDYFILHIALNSGGEYVDTIDFYLADYRFSDNSKDYIVDDWVAIDLKDFNSIELDTSFLEFWFSSSDTSFGYINTPTYFALDDIEYSIVTGTPVPEEFSAQFVNKGTHALIGVDQPAIVRCYTTEGKLVSEVNFPAGTHAFNYPGQETKLFIIEVQTTGYRSTHKVVNIRK